LNNNNLSIYNYNNNNVYIGSTQGSAIIKNDLQWNNENTGNTTIKSNLESNYNFAFTPIDTNLSNSYTYTFNTKVSDTTLKIANDISIFNSKVQSSQLPTDNNDLCNKLYVDNSFNANLNFSSNTVTNLKKSIINRNIVKTITVSNVKAKLDNPANIQQVYTFGQQIPNTWVAVGGPFATNPTNINIIAYSSDGFNWIGSSSGNTIFGNASGVAWNGTMWVAVGSGSNRIAYSSDGVTWIGSTSGNSVFNSNSQGIGIAWNGTMWVAVGGTNDNSTNTIAYSYYGETGWEGVTASNNFFTYGFGVAWNGTMWIAVGGGGNRTNTILYSYNGINWTGLGNSFFSGWAGSGVAWNGTMWVAVGEGNPCIIYSYNGINWTGVTGSTNIFNNIGKGVAWNGQMWTAVGGSNAVGNSPYTIAYSYDGINWTGVTGSTGIFRVQGYGLAWNGTMWTAVGGTTPFAYNSQSGILSPYTIAYSYNGVNWTGLSGSTGTFLYVGNGIAFNSKRPNTITFNTNTLDGAINIPDGSIVLNPDTQLDVVSDSYYNAGFTNCAISIKS
jgi:hypothetical protein